jgi:hypothetical protein
MRFERRLLRLGEYLVRLACRRLPQNIRAERCQEWAAELPAILHDPEVRFGWRRAIRVLSYAADTIRGAALTRARTRYRAAVITAAVRILLPTGLASVGGDIWILVRTPALPPDYLQLACGLLLVAFPISILAGAAVSVSRRIVISAVLLGVAADLWRAVQAPDDWWNYCAAAVFVVLLLVLRLAGQRASSRRA